MIAYLLVASIYTKYTNADYLILDLIVKLILLSISFVVVSKWQSFMEI